MQFMSIWEFMIYTVIHWLLHTSDFLVSEDDDDDFL